MESKTNEMVNDLTGSLDKLVNPRNKQTRKMINKDSPGSVNNILETSPVKVHGTDSREGDGDSPIWSASPTSSQSDRKIKTKGKGKKTDKVVPRFCLPECPHNGVYNSEMIQCHLCQIWHHYDTTNVKNMHLHRDSNPGPWNTVPML